MLNKVRDIGVETIKILEANYPEDLRKTVVINGKYINRKQIYYIFLKITCNLL